MVCRILCGPNVHETCFVSSDCRIRYTTGDNLEHIMYGPRHGWISFGFGPSVLDEVCIPAPFVRGLIPV